MNINLSNLNSIDFNGNDVQALVLNNVEIWRKSGYTPVSVPAVKFTAKQANSTIGLNKLSNYQTLQYSRNGSTWNSMTTSTTITLTNSGDCVYVRGVLNNNNSTTYYTQFTMSGDIKVSGNINYIWNKNNPDAALKQYCGYYLFNGCTALSDASELELLATTLAYGCYSYMFYGCTSLTIAPDLPATTLEGYCYQNMFRGCIALTTAPELPATTLSERCYQNMFYGCTSLTTAPELPATITALYCYYKMFYNCIKLNYIKCLATSLSGYMGTSNWVRGVAASGTFVKDSSMTSWTTGTSGIPSGWRVQNAA